MFTEYPDDAAQIQTLTQAIVLGSGTSQDIQAQYTDLPGTCECWNLQKHDLTGFPTPDLQLDSLTS